MHLVWSFRPIWLAIFISSSSFWLVDTFFWSYFSWLAKSGCQNIKLAGNTFPPFLSFWSPGQWVTGLVFPLYSCKGMPWAAAILLFSLHSQRWRPRVAGLLLLYCFLYTAVKVVRGLLDDCFLYLVVEGGHGLQLFCHFLYAVVDGGQSCKNLGSVVALLQGNSEKIFSLRQFC